MTPAKKAILVCPYCGGVAGRVDGDVIYPHRLDLKAKQFYLCVKCDAYVGCHPGTTIPLGRLANAELRAAKIAAHTTFDRLWRRGPMSRKEAYAWLAGKLDIPVQYCHIGHFDVTDCRRVVDVCDRGVAQPLEQKA